MAMDREAQLVSYQHKDLHQRKEATKEKTQTTLAGRQNLKVNEMTKKFMKTEYVLKYSCVVMVMVVSYMFVYTYCLRCVY